MQSEKYRSYILWGHAILQQKDILHAEKYAASCTITRTTGSRRLAFSPISRLNVQTRPALKTSWLALQN